MLSCLRGSCTLAGSQLCFCSCRGWGVPRTPSPPAQAVYARLIFIHPLYSAWGHLSGGHSPIGLRCPLWLLKPQFCLYQHTRCPELRPAAYLSEPLSRPGAPQALGLFIFVFSAPSRGLGPKWGMSCTETYIRNENIFQ